MLMYVLFMTKVLSVVSALINPRITFVSLLVVI